MNDINLDKLIKTKSIKSVGMNGSGGQLGIGFLEKSGKKIDEKDSSFFYYSLVYVIKGRGEYIDKDGNSYLLSEGSFFQRFPGLKHSNIIDPKSGWTECFMDFGTDIYNFMCSMRIINPRIPVYSLPSDLGILESFINYKNKLELSPESELPNLLLDCISFVQKLFTLNNLIPDIKIPQTEIDKYCMDLTTDLSQRIDLREYCEKQAIGYESFRKVFKNSMGISPGKYIIKRRIDYACQLLRTTNKTIGELSNDLGYKSQYEFSSQFKRETGISPLKYKNTH